MTISSKRKRLNRTVIFLFCLCLAGCASKKYMVEEEALKNGPSATLDLTMKEMALVIGGEKGQGILHFEGQDYPFTLKGLQWGSISKVRYQATGRVYHLDQLEDFEGVYFQAQASLALGQAGKSGLFLVNRRGVTMHLGTEEENGFALTLGRAGVKVKLVPEP
jgi:outer membrane immunogenic protein